MTETATIYYHKPKIRKTNFRSEKLLEAETELEALSLETSENAGNNMEEMPVLHSKNINVITVTECDVPRDSIFSYCANTLRSIGLTGKYDGFVYICRAVEGILTEKDSPHFQSIYYDIGKEYDVNRCSVERSIRYSIGYIKRSGNRRSLAAVFGDAIGDEKNFSNSKFLTILAADIYEKLSVLENAR